jgi:hypothetical protein
MKFLTNKSELMESLLFKLKDNPNFNNMDSRLLASKPNRIQLKTGVHQLKQLLLLSEEPLLRLMFLEHLQLLLLLQASSVKQLLDYFNKILLLVLSANQLKLNQVVVYLAIILLNLNLLVCLDSKHLLRLPLKVVSSEELPSSLRQAYSVVLLLSRQLLDLELPHQEACLEVLQLSLSHLDYFNNLHLEVYSAHLLPRLHKATVYSVLLVLLLFNLASLLQHKVVYSAKPNPNQECLEL